MLTCAAGLWLMGCTAPCDDGYGRAADGNCYPLEGQERQLDASSPYGLGIPGTTLLSDLSAEDWERICTAAVDTSAQDRIVDCGSPIGEITLEAQTVGSCETSGSYYTAQNCASTLQDWHDCVEGPDLTDGQICGVEPYSPTAACAALGDCFNTY